MQNVLIISYYFPPCNLTAAQRIGSWEKYLPENGFYPIVVTRNWTGEELNEVQRLKKSGTDIRHIQKDNSEIFYMPYRASFRDRCFEKGQANRFYRNLSKVLTAVYLIGQNFSIRFIPFNNLYFQARKILKNNPEIKHLIISGNPFEQFYFGYLLKKEFPQIKWIADYRDDWTTSEVVKVPFRSFHRYFEKKWIGTASCITTVSPYYKEKISYLLKIPGHIIYNGFNQLIENAHVGTPDSFVITYNGTLYETQNIEIFLEGLKLLIDLNPYKIIKLNMPGILFDQKQANRVLKNMKGYESNLVMTDRISKEEVIEIQKKSDLLLMISHSNIKGVTSSKIFEYISLQKPFIVCPNDHDVLEEIANKSGLGSVMDSGQQVLEFMKNSIRYTSKQPNLNQLNNYLVKSQVARLSNVINNVY